MGKGATSEAGKSLFRAANLLLPLVARCLETINVCIYNIITHVVDVTVRKGIQSKKCFSNTLH